MVTVSSAVSCATSLLLGAWLGGRSSAPGPAVPNITVLVRCGTGTGSECEGTGASVFLSGLGSEPEESGGPSWLRLVIDGAWWIGLVTAVGYVACWRRAAAAADRPQPVGPLPRLAGVPPAAGGRGVLGW